MCSNCSYGGSATRFVLSYVFIHPLTSPMAVILVVLVVCACLCGGCCALQLDGDRPRSARTAKRRAQRKRQLQRYARNAAGPPVLGGTPLACPPPDPGGVDASTQSDTTGSHITASMVWLQAWSELCTCQLSTIRSMDKS